MPKSTPVTQAHLSLNTLSKRYSGGAWGVRNLSLQLQKGQLLSVVGPSGCGKTTLLRLIAGFEQPQTGQILLQGECLAQPTHSTPPEERNIGLVFQEGALFPHLSVRENIAFGLRQTQPRWWFWRAKRSHKQAQQQRVEQLLALVGLEQESERLPHALSGGQQQRCALARALAPKPRLLLLDEPFASLDASLRSRLRANVAALLRLEGMSAMLVTHDQSEALEFGDEMAVMHAGNIVQQGPPLEVLDTPKTPFVAGFFGLNQFLHATWHRGALRSVFGMLPATTGTGKAWQEGQTVRVLVPPHRFCLAQAGKGVPATVKQVMWLNGAPRYLLCLEEGPALQTTALASRLLGVGETLDLAVTEGAFSAFALDASQAHQTI